MQSQTISVGQETVEGSSLHVKGTETPLMLMVEVSSSAVTVLDQVPWTESYWRR